MPQISLKAVFARVKDICFGRPEPERPETPLWGTPYPRSYYSPWDDQLESRLRRQGAMVWGDHGPPTARDQSPWAFPLPPRRADPQNLTSPVIPQRRSSLSVASRPLPPPPAPVLRIATPDPRDKRPATTLRPLRLPELIRQRAAASQGYAQMDDDSPWGAASDPFEFETIELQPLYRPVSERPPTPFADRAPVPAREPFDDRLRAAALRALRPWARQDAPRSVGSDNSDPITFEGSPTLWAQDADGEMRFTPSDWLEGEAQDLPPIPSLAGTPDSGRSDPRRAPKR